LKGRHDTQVTADGGRDDLAPEPRRYLIFAAPAADLRARRPIDVLVLVVSLVVAVLLGWAHRARTGVDREAVEVLAGRLPEWIDTTLTVVYLLGGVYAVGLLLAILFFGRGRAAVARDMLLAALVAIAVGVFAALLAGPEWPDFVPELRGREQVPSYPLLRLSAAIAVLTVAAPYLTVPMRRIGWRLIAAMTISGFLLGFGDVTAILGALAVGFGSAAAIHLIFGSGVGIPSTDRIMDGLRAIGLDPIEVEYLDEQPIGAALLRGRVTEHGEVLVKVYGRDATDAATWARFSRWIWLREERRALTATALQEVEHEALMLLGAERRGIPAPTLIGWGLSPAGDALIVTASPGGRQLSELSPEEIDDDVLQQAWQAVKDIGAVGAAHRSIDLQSIAVTDTGVMLTGLGRAQVSAVESTRKADLAQMLVATAVAVGPRRAIAAARDALGDERVAGVVPVVQGVVLSPALQADLKGADFRPKELRNAVSEELDVEPPELVELRRVTWHSVAMLALTVFAAYALISSLAGIGVDTIVDTFGDAEWGWVVTALILAQLTNIGEFLSMTGAVSRAIRVPFGPTIVFRYALSYVSLAVPGSAGEMAMNIRYQQKLGVPTARALAQGPLLTVFSLAFDAILFVVALQFVGADAADNAGLDELEFGPALRLLALALVLLVIGLVVTFAVPALRRRVVPPLRQGFTTVKDSVTDPERLFRIAAGTLMQKLLFALTLAASVAAFGDSLSLAEAIFVNTAVSLFVGLMPVPGGIGIGEAALAAGLVAVGVPEGAAFGAALTHRMVTSYLPPLFGWFANRWLIRNDYL
jgi:uncharacterized membrane protein YbhN (UPF0104 family)